MSGHLGEVSAHLTTTRELGIIITAMRNIAAARSREAHQRLEGVRTYATTLGTAIGEALAFLPEADASHDSLPGTRQHLILALCAEQGFAGVFSERVLEAASHLLDHDSVQLLVIGARGIMYAMERDLAPAWSCPMAVHPDEMPMLASQIVDVLYAQLGNGIPTRVTLVHTMPLSAGHQRVVQRSLLPFDYSRFAIKPARQPPETTLSPAQLITGLADEYVYAELFEALTLSFAAENEARMQAMVAAQSNVEARRSELLAEFRQVRQDEITDEIIELSAQRL